MLYLAFTSFQKCRCFTGIQLSWKDRQADRAVSPHLYCIVPKTLSRHDRCNLFCVSLSCNSVISTLVWCLSHCNACNLTGCFSVHSAAGIRALPPCFILLQMIRKAVGWGAPLIRCSFRFKTGVLAEFQVY